MKKAFEDYRYLAGSTSTSGSLWEGPDHLLYIQASGLLFAFSETYKRIDYAKIQTISLGRTRTFGWLTALMALPIIITGAVFAKLVMRSGGGLETAVVTGAISLGIILVFSVLLIVHLTKGPTCTVKLQTAVQVVNLRPLKRVRTAERVIARITELCRLHQGSEAVTTESLQGLPPASTFQQRGVKPPMPRSKLLTAALPLLVIAGAFFAGEPFVGNFAYTIGDILACIAGHLSVIIALAMLARYEMPGSLKFSMWGSAANFLLICLFAYGLIIFGSISMTTASLHDNKGLATIESEVNTGIFFWLAKLGFAELHGFAWIFVVLGGLSIFFALLGLPTLFTSRGEVVAEASAPPAVPTAPVVQPAASEQPEDQS